jgi:TfoX/Sxy family transcriptional regulator of competence genes
MPYDEKTAERIRHLLAERDDLVEKKLMGGIAFMVKGGMCCSVSGRGGLLVRVGPDVHERMIAKPHVRPMEMAGRTMTGFVRVMPEGYRTEASLKKWVQLGVDFVATLPVKPSASKRRRPSPKPRPAK